MRILFAFDGKKCTACGACAVACMDQNDVDVTGGQRPYRRVYQAENSGRFTCVSAACLHCPDAPCADACPAGCFYREADTGLVLYDNQNCTGCRSCAAACPCDALSFRPVGGQERMEKCDGCRERIRAGLQPACVHTCPTGALSWRWEEEDHKDTPGIVPGL